MSLKPGENLDNVSNSFVPALSKRGLEVMRYVTFACAMMAADDAGAKVSELPLQKPSLSYDLGQKAPSGYGSLNSLFSVQQEERNARKSGASLNTRYVDFRWEKMTQTGLSIFFNDGQLLKNVLEKEKTIVKTIGVKSINRQNVWEVVDRVFQTKWDEQWLRKTQKDVSLPFNEKEFSEYSKSITDAKVVLMDRLVEPAFQAYFIERANTLLPVIEKNGMLGRKTVQTAMTGIVSLWDASAYAMIKKLTGKDIANPIGWFDQMSNIARLSALVNPNVETMRMKISVPNTNKTLIYFVAQNRPAAELFGNISKAFQENITPEETIQILNERIRTALRNMNVLM